MPYLQKRRLLARLLRELLLYFSANRRFRMHRCMIQRRSAFPAWFCLNIYDNIQINAFSNLLYCVCWTLPSLKFFSVWNDITLWSCNWSKERLSVATEAHSWACCGRWSIPFWCWRFIHLFLVWYLKSAWINKTVAFMMTNLLSL